MKLILRAKNERGEGGVMSRIVQGNLEMKVTSMCSKMLVIISGLICALQMMFKAVTAPVSWWQADVIPTGLFCGNLGINFHFVHFPTISVRPLFCYDHYSNISLQLFFMQFRQTRFMALSCGGILKNPRTNWIIHCPPFELNFHNHC